MKTERLLGDYFKGTYKKLTIPKNNEYNIVMPELIKTAKLIAEQAEDMTVYVSPKRRMVLEEDNTLSFEFGEGRRSYKLRPIALRQLCEKVYMPSSFFNRLAASEETRDLAYVTLNRMLSMYKGNMYIRACKDEIRGVLSTRYYRFDSDKILKVIKFFFEHNPFIKPEDVYIDGYVNDMERFHLRISQKFPGVDPEKNDLRYGLIIDSSDVGLSSLRVRFFIYKLLCTNGLVLKCFESNLFWQSHIGHWWEADFAAKLTQSFRMFPRFAKEASAMISDANTYYICGTGLMDFDLMDKDALVLRRRMEKELGLGESSLKELAEIARTKYRPTVWGYVNAITEYAQRYDIDRRTQLEQVAGRILDKPERYFVA